MRAPTETPPLWTGLTRALTGGLTIASAGFFLIAITQPTGLDPPPETAALFLVAMTAAAISYLLLANDLRRVGAVAALLSGGYVLVATVVVVVGTYGPAGPETNPVGPIAWIVLSLGVMWVAFKTWRGR